MATSKGDGILRPDNLERARRTLKRGYHGQEYLGEHSQEIQTPSKSREYRHKSEQNL
jgi:hypothetical protein